MHREVMESPCVFFLSEDDKLIGVGYSLLKLLHLLGYEPLAVSSDRNEMRIGYVSSIDGSSLVVRVELGLVGVGDLYFSSLCLREALVYDETRACFVDVTEKIRYLALRSEGDASLEDRLIGIIRAGESLRKKAEIKSHDKREYIV